MDFAFAKQQMQNNKARIRRPDHKLVSSTADYLILGVSNGKPVLEVVYFQYVGSILSSTPLVTQYRLTWDDIIATDWEIV